MIKVLKDSNFSKFITGTTVSAMGSYAFNFAFMSYLYFETGNDKRFVALSQLFFVVGMLLGNLTGGPIAQKMNRKKLLLICEVARIPLVILMFVFSNTIWPLLFLHGARTYFAGMSTPLKRTFITDTLEPEHVQDGNMAFTISYSITQILGPLIGTWMYFYFKELQLIILLDLATFVLATLLFWKVKFDGGNISKSAFRIVNDLKDAYAYIRQRASLSSLFLKHTLVGCLTGILLPLILPFTVEVLKSTEKEYGVFMFVFGVGGILGAIISKKLNARLGIAQTIALICLIEPLLMFLWIQGTSLYFAYFVFGVWGGVFFLRATTQFNYLAKYVSKDYLSRINGLFDFVFTITSITATTLITLGGTEISTKSFLYGACLIYGVFIILEIVINKSKFLEVGHEIT